MEIEQPKTPELSCILTPPLTGGSIQQANFNDEELANAHSWVLISPEEEDAHSRVVRNLREASKLELNCICDGNINSTAQYGSAAAPNLNSRVTFQSTNLENHDSFSSLVTPNDGATPSLSVGVGPFRFMDFPISVRVQIYEEVLVIPAMICVRQKYTSVYAHKKNFLYAEDRLLVPGIAYALAQITVDGHKAHFSRFDTTNINILQTCKEVYTEARAVLYGKNQFETVKPSNEMAASPNFRVRVFPHGCQRLVTKLNMCIRSFYGLDWLLNGKYNNLKNYYQGLNSLTLILEMASTSEGFGKKWSRRGREKWQAYIHRLQRELARDICSTSDSNKVKFVPTWIDLRVLFNGERYCASFNTGSVDPPGSVNIDSIEQSKRNELRFALVEAWELSKKGGR